MIPTEPIGSLPRPVALRSAVVCKKAPARSEVCDSVLEAANYIPLTQLGTTDDCGFSPFCDALAARTLGLRQ